MKLGGESIANSSEQERREQKEAGGGGWRKTWDAVCFQTGGTLARLPNAGFRRESGTYTIAALPWAQIKQRSLEERARGSGSGSGDVQCWWW